MILHLDCPMGLAGDMLLGALLALHPHREDALARLNGLGLPGIGYSVEERPQGLHAVVAVYGAEEGHEHQDAHHHHHHHTIADICHILDSLHLPAPVRDNAKAVYGLLADAESKAHGCTVEQIHFHEVGTLDAVADVVGCCLLLEELSVERVTASPVAVGGGTVCCAHGVLPVPAPATAFLLEGIPTVPGPVERELCTPTGAALLCRFAADFGPRPAGTWLRTGVGLGTREFPDRVNGVTAHLGTP